MAIKEIMWITIKSERLKTEQKKRKNGDSIIMPVIILLAGSIHLYRMNSLYKILCGDAYETLKQFPDNCIDVIFTKCR